MLRWVTLPSARRGGQVDGDPPRASSPPAPAKRHRSIELRRFAGPSAHVGALDGLRVAHLTDLHVGRVTPLAVQRDAVALTNAQRPDLVALTGDFVCHSQQHLDELTEVVRGFQAPVVGVLGNHDHWSGAKEVRRALARAGALVLDNRHTTLELRGQRLQVVGLDDAYTGHARLDEAVKGLRRDTPTLGLSHIGEEAEGLWAHGVPLVLSGHTHAGQVTLARLHELAIGRLAGHRYVHGLYGRRSGSGAVYVGAGIGASVMPIRLGERGRREVTLFELGARPGSLPEHHDEQPPLPGRKRRAPAARPRAPRGEAKKGARGRPR
ncbi:MAG: metallophosphoesterase family protein [Polyangiaceae bacterium]|nr:metallophosphoesterase family protein [Polyangiaceae bacterium]